MNFSVIENGIILPHERGIPGNEFWGGAGIVDNKGEYISNSFIHAGWGVSYNPPLESIQHRSETVIYLGMFYPVWGHVLTDNIRRMWFLKSDFFKKDFKICPLVYVSWRELPLEQYLNFQRLLEIMEVDANRFQAIEQPTQFDKIIFPDDSFTRTFSEDLIKAYDMPYRWEYFRPLINYQTHVGIKGWSDGEKSEDQVSNPIDQKRDIQAIKINFLDCKIYYSVYYNDEEGWSKEVLAPKIAGTIGKAKSIYGIRICLDEAGANKFDIFYRVHKFDDTWTLWAKNGETIYSHGVKLNAIQIKLEAKT